MIGTAMETTNPLVQIRHERGLTGRRDGAPGGLRRPVLVRGRGRYGGQSRRVLDALAALGYDADALRTRYQAWRDEARRRLSEASAPTLIA